MLDLRAHVPYLKYLKDRDKVAGQDKDTDQRDRARQLPPGVLTINQSERVTTIQCVGYHPNISFDINMHGVSIVMDMPHEALQPTYMTADRFLMRPVQVPEVTWYNGYYVWRYEWLHF